LPAAPRSLKSRALQLLAQRDQSRLELRRKLARHARDSEPDDAERSAAMGEQVEALLDWLEANGFLSNERFIESRVHARQARFGNLRIKSELAQHAVALPAALARDLEESEFARALAVRARRFGAVPREIAERARQSRFLLGRGFSPELVQRVMRELRQAEGDAGAPLPGEPA
jgi:regulatory protein